MISNWQKKIQQENSEAHRALQIVAEKIFDEGCKSIKVNTDDQSTIEIGIALEYLSWEEDKIVYRDLNLLEEYLVYYVLNVIDNKWNSFEKVVGIFRKNERLHYQIGISSNLNKKVLLLLVKEYNKDLFDFIIKASSLRTSNESQYDFLRLYKSFCEILPELEVEAKSIISILDAICADPDQETISENHAIGKAIEKIATKEKDIGETLYTLLMSRVNKPYIYQIYSILRSIAKTNIVEAHTRALGLTTRTEPVVRRVGIQILGELEYQDPDSSTLLNLTLENFQELRKSSHPETDWALISAYENLTKYTEEAQQAFINFAKDPNPLIWKNTLSSLWGLSKNNYSMTWYKKSIVNFVKIQKYSLEELKLLDYCISEYIQDDPDFMLDLVGFIAKNWYSSNHINREKLTEGLDSTFSHLNHAQNEKLSFRFTQWIASEKLYLHLLAFEIVSYFNSIPILINGQLEQDKNPTFILILNKEALDNLKDEEIVNILKRIVGYVIDPSYLCALILSVLKRDNISKKIIDVVDDLLTNYVLFNYPGEASKYLTKKSQQENINEIEKTLIRQSLLKSQEYLKNRNKLPKLKEFQPPSQRVYFHNIAKFEQQNEISKRLEEQSVWSQIMPSRLFLYGKSTSTEEQGEFTEPRPFIELSSSVEIPQGELICPVFQNHQRMQWRCVSLSNIEQESIEEENE
jgi:hypothetical protein